MADLAQTAGDHTLIGVLFFAVMAGLGIWSLWQRRHAWGWWESPTTLHVGLLVLGSLCATPIFFGRQSLPWWGHAYVAANIFTVLGLASFTVTLQRRTSRRASALAITLPSAVGIGVVVVAYIASGAVHNPWLLDSTVTGLNAGVRVFWITVALELGYLLSIIAHHLLRLRADTRRGDRSAVTVYLASCFAGMTLVVIAIAAASGYGLTPAVVIESAVLFGLMTGGNIAIGALSWRRKVERMRAAPRRYSSSGSSGP